jgi:hypothetical protein
MNLKFKKILFGSLIGLNLLFPSYTKTYDFLSSGEERCLIYDSPIINSLDNTFGKKDLESKLFYDTGDFIDSFEQDSINYGKYIGTNDFDDSSGFYFYFKKNSNNSFSFSYFNRGNNSISLEDRTKLLFRDYLFVEDRNNTHLYLVLPKEVYLEELEQNLLVLKNNFSQTSVIKAYPNEETKTYKFFKKLDNYTEDKLNNLERNIIKLEDFEKKYFSNVPNDSPYVSLLRKVPGKVGKLIDYTVFLSKLFSEIKEDQRKRIFQEDFGENYNIYKIPFYSSEKEFNPFVVGREIKWDLNLNDLKWYNIGYLAIPLITFNQQKETLEQTSLENLLFKFELNPFL